MAIELGKINVSDLAENDYKVIGIGINKTSDSNGIFAVNYTTLKQAKDNLTNLIMTKKGERELNPTFGCDIWDILFEPIIDETINTKVENSILDAVNIWLPYLEIQQIIFDYDENDIDTNRIILDIKFALKSNTSLTDTLVLDIKN